MFGRLFWKFAMLRRWIGVSSMFSTARKMSSSSREVYVCFAREHLDQFDQELAVGLTSRALERIEACGSPFSSAR